MKNITPAQTAAIETLTADYGQPYWPTVSTRPNGLLDITFRSGYGFVIEPHGEVRPA
jgi:hypothetical protein